jgi:YCII-related domain
MAEFIFTYRMPRDYTMGDADTMRAWQAWFAGIGDELINMGKPARAAEAVGSCGEGTWLGGFSIIRADSAEQAREIAERCPGLASGGGVEVGSLVEIP